MKFKILKDPRPSLIIILIFKVNTWIEFRELPSEQCQMQQRHKLRAQAPGFPQYSKFKKGAISIFESRSKQSRPNEATITAEMPTYRYSHK